MYRVATAASLGVYVGKAAFQLTGRRPSIRRVSSFLKKKPEDIQFLITGLEKKKTNSCQVWICPSIASKYGLPLSVALLAISCHSCVKLLDLSLLLFKISQCNDSRERINNKNLFRHFELLLRIKTKLRLDTSNVFITQRSTMNFICALVLGSVTNHSALKTFLFTL